MAASSLRPFRSRRNYRCRECQRFDRVDRRRDRFTGWKLELDLPDTAAYERPCGSPPVTEDQSVGMEHQSRRGERKEENPESNCFHTSLSPFFGHRSLVTGSSAAICRSISLSN